MKINIPKLKQAGFNVEFEDKNRVLHIQPAEDHLYNLSIDAMEKDLHSTALTSIQIECIITSYIETVHTFCVVNAINKIGE